MMKYPSDHGITDFQREPKLTDDEWRARFVARMVKCVPVMADGPTADYAKSVVDSYLEERQEYIDPEEAADTDISYWED